MRTIAVRYCSRTPMGNTRRIAEAIADGAGVKAVSIDDEPELTDEVDILFLGGAPYANIMAPELRKYAETLNPQKVGRVILFTTSNWSRRTVLALEKIFRKLNIEGKLNAAREFGAENTESR